MSRAEASDSPLGVPLTEELAVAAEQVNHARAAELAVPDGDVQGAVAVDVAHDHRVGGRADQVVDR